MEIGENVLSGGERGGAGRRRGRSLTAREPARLTNGGYLFADARRDLISRAGLYARVSRPPAVVCRRTAAFVWGVDVLPPGRHPDAWDVELMVPRGHTPARRPGCAVYQGELPAGDVTREKGMWVTTKARTALDCGRWLPRMEALAALDRFLRIGVDREDLLRRAQGLSGRRNARRLRDLIELADPRAQSPSESWTRALLTEYGLPRPEPQIHVPLPDGRWVFIDMGWRKYRVGVEYDGAAHHTTPRQREHDERRRRELAEAGWLIIPVRKGDILGSPHRLIEHVTEKLMDRGWAPGTDEAQEIRKALLRAAARHAPGTRRRDRPRGSWS
ncbi:DUF559 domain-containing protein [Bailinhaonella thermotolerans]|uniref:DUF559 domain-containing protein n=1 Tax=Bailinhaonella thermotolerans TaxID=1070861 RepID=A0A3A4AUL5_9ACTN|nr:DUF559 domain-containing protein [Bailinhaonella thermotolerans]RJL25138.1 DUF559 domain-containing protein [Bailinhaonella thermotolerans]